MASLELRTACFNRMTAELDKDVPSLFRSRFTPAMVVKYVDLILETERNFLEPKESSG